MRVLMCSHMCRLTVQGGLVGLAQYSCLCAAAEGVGVLGVLTLWCVTVVLTVLQMFMPTILSQGDHEQQAKWLPACLSLQVWPALMQQGVAVTAPAQCAIS